MKTFMLPWVGLPEGNYIIEVEKFYEYLRGPDGLCAFCKADPCNEKQIPGTTIFQFYQDNPEASTCPCCDGRPI